ncbi:FtsX-like permease family protein [Desulfotomaculum defluvii]
MNNLFSLRLAIINIKKNSKTYLPFIITCICTIMMFYIMHAISVNEGLEGKSGSQSLKSILRLGTIIIGIFSAIFLYYTNSFLLKRRKKEIGLYNVLGLEKKHIARVLLFESIITFLISITLGIVGGVVLNKLMFLVLLKLLNFEVAFGFSLSVPSMLRTLIVFLGIFLVILLSNLLQIRMLKPIDLLKGSQHGEREPKTKWVMTIVGLIALGTGYGIALSVKSPLAALNQFFIAVILVMIGTYALFTAGSIALLKLLRKNKGFYYQTRHFISISGMLYRMKQNAVGLANICILSTAVLVTFSTTVALYVGVEDALKSRFPRDIVMVASDITSSEAQKLEKILESEIKNNNLTIRDKFNYWNITFGAQVKEGRFSLKKEVGYNSNLSMLTAIPVSDYNRLEGKNVSLSDDEVIIFSPTKKYGKDTITIDEKTFKVKKELDSPVLGMASETDIVDSYLVFLNDINLTENNDKRKYLVCFDIESSDQNILLLSKHLNQKFMDNQLTVQIESPVSHRQDFYMIYGGLFFIGIFLGSLFLMATVLIIYYKQISEGYDDKERFEIMQKVGMTKTEIKGTIKSQILTVFFLPLASTVLHITFAFPMITKLLAVLNLKNVALFQLSTVMTILVFAVIYSAIYSLTAREYYKIVE